MSNTFAVGDRVVVESPVYCHANYAHDPAPDAPAVGDEGTVVHAADFQGDLIVDLDRTRENEYVHADGLIRVDDLDAVAAERALAVCSGPCCKETDYYFPLDTVPAPATPRDGKGADEVSDERGSDTVEHDDDCRHPVTAAQRRAALAEARALGAAGTALVTVAEYILTGSTR